MSKELEEALEGLKHIKKYYVPQPCSARTYDYLEIIEQALLREQKIEEETYVIYCVNNYHNIYMDYKGDPCIYQEATIFNDKFEAHKFLREKGTNDYYIWSVFNVKDLSEDRKHRQE